MEPLIGVGDGRLAFSLHWGKVEKVYRNEPRYGAMWLADVRLTTGAPVEKARVIGNRLPLVHSKDRPSWGLVGYIAANVQDAVFWPCPPFSETDQEIQSHDLLDRHEFFTFHIENQRIDATPEAPSGTSGGAFGVYTIRAPGNAPPNEDNGAANRYFQIVSAPRKSPGRGGKVQMMGGGRRLARAGSTGDGGPGDYIAIDAASSPIFVEWMKWVTNMLTAIATLSQAGGGPIPPAAAVPPVAPWVTPPFAPFAGTGPDGAPLADAVPAVDGGEAPAPPEAAQVAGRIVTGSTTVTGA